MKRCTIQQDSKQSGYVTWQCPGEDMNICLQVKNKMSTRYQGPQLIVGTNLVLRFPLRLGRLPIVHHKR